MRRSSREDEEAIRKVIVEMTEGFNQHDAKVATRMYMPAHQEISIRVFVKEQGTWRVAAFHNTMVRLFGTPTLQ